MSNDLIDETGRRSADGALARTHSEEEIREELDLILRSREFQAESLRRFLRFVVEETLAGRTDLIKAYTVAVRAFDRPKDFDPQTDTIVRVQARRLRRALRYYYGTDGAHDPVLIEIPLGTYVPVFSRRSTEHRPPTTVVTSPIANDVGPVVRESIGPSIAVMTPHALHGDPELQSLSGGLAHALVVALTRFPEFTIIGPLSRDRLGDSERGPRDIGRRYGADFVLDGQIRKQADRFRLAVSLVNAQGGQTLWADTYDSQDFAADPFAFEDTVASKITAAVADHYGVIHRTLTPQALRSVGSIEVYDAILRYYHFTAEFHPEMREPTRRALQQAIETQPENALLLAMLAEIYVVDYMSGESVTSLERAEGIAGQAVSLDTRCGHARYVCGCLHFVRGRRGPSESELETALALSPHRPETMSVIGTLLSLMGSRDRGLKLIQDALRLNPHLPQTYRIGLFVDHYRMGQFEKALVHALQMSAPDFYLQPLFRAAALAQLRRQGEATAALQDLLALQPDFHARAHDLLRRWVFSEENSALLLDGLRLAGLQDVGR